MPIPLGILAVAGAGGGALANSFDLLETTVLSSSAASVTFSNLGNYSSTYKHLQLRCVVQNSAGIYNLVALNGDTGSNYDFHDLTGTGATVSSNASATASSWTIISPRTADGASIFGSFVLDILDAFSTNKYKTSKLLLNYMRSAGTREVKLQSGLWRNTNSITSISLNADGNNFVTGSRFSLYGIK